MAKVEASSDAATLKDAPAHLRTFALNTLVHALDAGNPLGWRDAVTRAHDLGDHFLATQAAQFLDDRGEAQKESRT